MKELQRLSEVNWIKCQLSFYENVLFKLFFPFEEEVKGQT